MPSGTLSAKKDIRSWSQAALLHEIIRYPKSTRSPLYCALVFQRRSSDKFLSRYRPVLQTLWQDLSSAEGAQETQLERAFVAGSVLSCNHQNDSRVFLRLRYRCLRGKRRAETSGENFSPL